MKHSGGALMGFRPTPVTSGPRTDRPPPEWGPPYADASSCWGCGGTPTLSCSDKHYGHGQLPRLFCDWCWQLTEPLMRKLPRPPLGSGGFPEPLTVELLSESDVAAL